MNKPTVRVRFNSNGAQVFEPIGRNWLPIDATIAENIQAIFFKTFGFRTPESA